MFIYLEISEKNAYVRNGNGVIISRVYVIPIFITPSSIAKAISCVETGYTVEHFPLQYPFNEQLVSLHDASSIYEPTNHRNLLPIPKIWFKLLLTNFYPVIVNKRILTHSDNLFIYFLLINFVSTSLKLSSIFYKSMQLYQ